MGTKRTPAAAVALGGVLAALAVVIMSMGTLIPVATYVCPMLCAMLLQVVLRQCGSRIAWAWYGAVAVLSALLAPDKEAAAVFVFLGYYPIVKPRLDRTRLPWLWKAVLFNGAVCLLYWLLMHIFGMSQLSAEFAQMGTILLAACLVMGNVVFFLLDRLLSGKLRKRA